MKSFRINVVGMTAATAAVLFTSCTAVPHPSAQPEASCHRRATLEACLVFYRSGAPIAYDVDAIRRALEETLSPPPGRARTWRPPPDSRSHPG